MRTRVKNIYDVDATREAAGPPAESPDASTVRRNAMMDRFFGGILPQIVLALTVFLVWGQSLSFQFVWDDESFIEQLSSIRSLKYIPRMFTALDAQSVEPEQFKLFRPLRTAQYALLYALGGGEPPKPWLFHLANVCWHAIATILFYHVLRRFLVSEGGGVPTCQSQWLALLAALGFAVHPVVSEVVCWAKSLDDIMAAVFVLGALLLLQRWEPRHTSRPYYLALFLFPAFCFLFFIDKKRLSFKESFLRTAPFLAVGAVFMVHRHWVIGQTSQCDPISGSYGQTLVDMCPVIGTYLRLAVGLPPYCIDYSYLRPGHSLMSPAVLGGIALLVALIWGCLWSLRQPKLAVAGLGICWAALFLVPVSNVMPTMQFIAERFLYLPLFGCIWAAAHLALLLPDRRRFSLLACGAIVVVWAGLAWNRSWIWQDNVTLFTQSNIDFPNCKRIEDNAVYYVLKQPQLRQIFKVKHSPGHANSLEFPNVEKFTPDEWQLLAATAIELQKFYPSNALVIQLAGLAYRHEILLPEKIKSLTLALQTNPKDTNGWCDLGKACLSAGQYPAAETNLLRALTLNPDHVETLKNLFLLYWKEEKLQACLDLLNRLKQLEPANPEHERWIVHVKRKMESAKPLPAPLNPPKN